MLFAGVVGVYRGDNTFEMTLSIVIKSTILWNISLSEKV